MLIYALRERKDTEANIEEGLNLIESLGNTELAKSVGKVRRTLSDKRDPSFFVPAGSKANL